MPTYEAVLFDFGGTLFSYRPFRERFERMLAETAAEHGVETGTPELLRAYAEASAAVGRSFLQRSYYLHRDFFGSCGEAFVRALGSQPVNGMRERFYAAQTEVARPLIAPRDDARSTLGELRRRGLHVGVVSNIDNDQFGELWRLCGLDSLIDAYTTSEEARSCKPDPAIFRLSLAKAGGLPPERVLFVGDSLHHDAAGAAALGMATAYIGDRPPDADAGVRVDHELTRLSDLLKLAETGGPPR